MRGGTAPIDPLSMEKPYNRHPMTKRFLTDGKLAVCLQCLMEGVRLHVRTHAMPMHEVPQTLGICCVKSNALQVHTSDLQRVQGLNPQA